MEVLSHVALAKSSDGGETGGIDCIRLVLRRFFRGVVQQVHCDSCIGSRQSFLPKAEANATDIYLVHSGTLYMAMGDFVMN